MDTNYKMSSEAMMSNITRLQEEARRLETENQRLMDKANTTNIQLSPGITDKTTSQDILNITNAIDIASKIKLSGGGILPQEVIGDLIKSLKTTNQKYLTQILKSGNVTFYQSNNQNK